MPTSKSSKLLNREFKEYRKEISRLNDLYQENSFSSEEYKFIPEESDFEVIKKDVSNILLYVTNDCNSNCKICFRESLAHDESQEMSQEEIKDILQKIGRGKRITLIGGEPTVRRDLFNIIHMIKKSGNSPELFTNGLKLANVNYVKKLQESELERVYLSFDGFREEIYDKMRGGAQELPLKLHALQNLKFFDFDVILSATIAQGINEDQIKPILDFSIENVRKSGFIDGVHFYGATNFGRYNLDESTATGSLELISLLERKTNKQVDLDYLLETKKLLLNLARATPQYAKRLFPNFGNKGLVGVYEPGSIKRSFDISTLRSLNECLSSGQRLKALVEGIKSSKIRQILSGVLKGKGMIDALGDNHLLIGCGIVNNPKAHKPSIRDTIGLGKSLGPTTVNGSSHAQSME